MDLITEVRPQRQLGISLIEIVASWLKSSHVLEIRARSDPNPF
ncbi:MAG: hypothetical protein PVI11_04015 [Candidatus Aminicenantes bacterium]